MLRDKGVHVYLRDRETQKHAGSFTLYGVTAKQAEALFRGSAEIAQTASLLGISTKRAVRIAIEALKGHAKAS